MTNEERAEKAFERFIRDGEVWVGQHYIDFETLTRQDVINDIGIHASNRLMMALSENKLLLTGLTESINEFNKAYELKAFDMIVNLINKYYKDE
jgi:beta-lactamase superfamily II metal-dependent hydrolase